jgi:hypothetical protein
MARKSSSAMQRQIRSKALRNAAFRRKLLKSPHKALADEGIDVPKGHRLKVVENTPKVTYLVLPSKPKVTAKKGGRKSGQMGASFTFV